MDLFDINNRINTVVVLKNILKNDTMKLLKDVILLADNYDENDAGSFEAFSDSYVKFIDCLYKNGCNLGTYIKDLLFEDENIYVVLKGQKKAISVHIENALENELEVFSLLSKLSKADLKIPSKYFDSLPDFDNTEIDFVAEYKNKIDRLFKDGYGVYSKYHMFKVGNDGEILPVKSADTQSVDDLIGYETERNKVIANTKALLDGKPAANMLLYGAAGTGKSSTVKATANLLKSDGIRLVEIKKEQLLHLPVVMEQIADNPLKFIIFIDDLTFSSDEQGFGTLKAILEGSASAKARNAVIYATSNRRHMVKETFSARDGDEIHRNDTIAEQTSLSERFGQTVLFDKPNKFQYLAIVKALAQKAGLEYTDDMGIKAEAFAMRKSGRSARCAKQFVDGIISEL